ncbi:formate--tetrahydrofolate ligase [Thermoplasmatales archaeon AK]|nr:formate--tetrahydrofolate ligase [Thermoplasmatales archaeon AK]
MAQKLQPIEEVASKIGIGSEFLEKYGSYMAKVSLNSTKARKPSGKLIMVTAMNPTKEGEGKTTTSIGLAQAIAKLGKKVAVAIREPSLGPCFGVKGGATGGGMSKVEPSNRINLIFTGDFPAVSAAHNLLSAMINNHIYHGNRLRIDPRSVVWPRTIDMNDRSLRDIIVGVDEGQNGVMMRDRFVITPASELMAILGLSLSYRDLKERIGRIIIGFTYDGKPVYCRDLKAEGAMAALLSDALRPNIVQTTEGVPAFIHTGPFGNIAHGTSSIIADKIALSYADYLVTETGFGSELGAQKFLDMVTRLAALEVNAVVIVATIRSMKLNGGAKDPEARNDGALASGFSNLLRHVEIIRKYGLEPIVALNVFSSDTKDEMEFVARELDSKKIRWAKSEVYSKGGEGGIDIAKLVITEADKPPSRIMRTYEPTDSIMDKIRKIATRIYGADDVVFTRQALKDIKMAEKLGLSGLDVCMAKTQYSISDNPELLGSPKNFTVTVRAVNIAAGAGFLVVLLGEIMTMPGLPKNPSAENVDINDEGEIVGLS